MKVVYRDIFTYTVNNEELEATEIGNWHYGELPNDYQKEYSLEELKNGIVGYCIERWFSFQQYRIRPWRNEASVKEKDFINAITYVVHKPIIWTYSVEDLAKQLPADEFADWCKDKGICNICIGK